MNLCESCKVLECSFRKDGRLVHACHSHDPITIADLAAKDAYWQDRIVRERKETQDLYANGVLTAIAPLAERPCIGATHGTGFVLVGRVWHEESEVRKAAKSLGLREPPAVVVPELPTWEDCENKLRRGEKLTALEKFVMEHDWHKTDTRFRDGLEAVFAELRAIPADRVLGDGMVAVDRNALLSLFYVDDNGGPRFPTPREQSLLDALRANQGGAAT